MSKFKPGDKVTPIDVEYHEYSEAMEQLLGKTLVVRLVSSFVHNTSNREFVLAGIPGEESCYWREEDLRLVSNSEPTDPLPEEEKPLERGDLVEFCGAIWVVFSKDANGEYMIAPLTGGSNCCYSVINKLPRVGSIRKKVNRLQAQMEDVK